MGPKNRVLDGGPAPLMGMDNFEGKGQPIVKYRYALLGAVQQWLNRSRRRLILHGKGHI